MTDILARLDELFAQRWSGRLDTWAQAKVDAEIALIQIKAQVQIAEALAKMANPPNLVTKDGIHPSSASYPLSPQPMTVWGLDYDEFRQRQFNLLSGTSQSPLPNSAAADADRYGQFPGSLKGIMAEKKK